MKKLLIISALLCSVVSCKEFADVAKESAKNGTKTTEIVFNANIGKYTIKATNTSFEENDAVAILADRPINSGFVKYVVQNGALSSETPICWEDGDYSSPDYDPEEGVAFCLVYPYDPELTAWDMAAQPYYKVGVNADQSTHSLYTASDFMVGEGAGVPEDEDVYFDVDHQFSQVYIRIDKRTGTRIKDVYLSDVYGKGIWNWDVDFVVCGEKGTIKACPVQGSSTQNYILIIPPQTSQPKLIITTTSDEQITYTLPSKVTFVAGHQIKANVVLDANSSVTEFTSTVTEWTPDNELMFGNDGKAGEWEYMGMGKMMEDVFASIFGIDHEEIDVEYYSDRSNPNRVMIRNPYESWYGLRFYSNDFELLKERHIILNMTDDGKRYIEAGSSTGISYSLYSMGEFFLESYCMENGWVGTKEEGTYLTEDYGKGCWSAYDAVTSGSVQYSILAICKRGDIYGANDSGMAIFSFPGCERMPKDTDSKLR